MIKQPKNGLFITLEGGEGVGKTTLSQALKQRFESEGYAVLLTREPGGTPEAESIRNLLVTGDKNRWDAINELLLLTAARRHHIHQRILPALQTGQIVLCDRYIDSTRCYQGIGKGVARAKIDRLHHEMIGVNPDITLLLDAPPELGLARAQSRSVLQNAALQNPQQDSQEDRFERHGLAFHQRLREGFLEIAQGEPERCYCLDATQSAAQIVEQAWTRIVKKIKQSNFLTSHEVKISK